MPDISVSAEVEAIIGAEEAARFRAGVALMQGQCWLCENPVDAATEPASAICLIPEAGGGHVHMMTMAHAGCSPSTVLHLTNAQVDARRAMMGDAATENSGTDVTVTTSIWPSGPDGGRPTVLVAFHNEMSAAAESGDRVDLLSAYFLDHGWEMTTRMGRAIHAHPPGWLIRWSLHPGRPSQAPGRFELLDPAGNQIALVDPLHPGALWTPGVIRAQATAVYIVPVRLDQWEPGEFDYPALQRAARDGRTVGAIIPVEVTDSDGRPFTA